MNLKIKDILDILLGVLLIILGVLISIGMTAGILYLVSILVVKLWNLIPNISLYPSVRQVFIVLCILWVLRITFLPLNNQQGR